jgi:hypothetical protein
MYTVPQIIQIAKLSQALADDDIAKGSLFGRRLDPLLAVKIYCVRKDVEWLYDLDPDSEHFPLISNFLLALCEKYAMRAWAILSGASGGRVVTPITPVPSTASSNIAFYIVKKSDFTNATDYTNEELDSKDISVFGNWINRYLEDDEYVLLTGGVVRILIDGFDSSAFEDGKIIMRVDVNGEAPPSTIVNVFTYDLTGLTTITDIPSGADYQTRRFIIRPNGFSYVWDSNYFEFDDLHPEQPDATGVGTVQIYDFVYDPVSGKNLCSNQIITV